MFAAYVADLLLEAGRADSPVKPSQSVKLLQVNAAFSPHRRPWRLPPLLCSLLLILMILPICF